jgi:hypothetical protein
MGHGFLAKIKPAYGKLLRFITERPVELVIGNHDLFLAMSPHLYPFDIHEGYAPGTHDGGWWAEHGNKADPLNDESGGWFGRAASWLNGQLLERLLGVQGDELYGRFKQYRRQILAGRTAAQSGNFLPGPYEAHAIRICKLSGARMFIFGHTHRRWDRLIDGRLVANVPNWKSQTYLYCHADRYERRAVP